MTDPTLHTQPISSTSTIGDRYRIGDPIGRGGRATVYAATDLLLQRKVAVKVFTSTASAAVDLKLQEAEARLLGGMNHYALTTLYDAGIDTTDPTRPRIYLVMEHIPGLDLRKHIAAHGPLTPAQVALLGFDLAEGLQFVHEHGFLHRDIKPANVLIADRAIDSRIRGKLADFGISTLIGTPDDGETTTGTAAYLSPEQVEGVPSTQASDIYSLGLVLLEALTGMTEFPGDVETSAFARLDRDPRMPPSIPPALADALRWMTALQPIDRPNLSEVGIAFQRALIQDMINAGRITPTLLADDEEERLAAVRRYNILDTPADDAFDRITHLATRLLHVPIALVSIIDADREWFKSAHGITIREIDRNVALCASSVAHNRPHTIPDVQADPAYADNTIVRADPALHGFAVVPLRTDDGHAIGTLCVFDRTIRTFTRIELDDLTDLAAMAMRELDFRLSSRRALFND